MVNQDPQPEIYETIHTFADGADPNTVNSQYINTFQGANEEARIYAVGVQILDPITGKDISAQSSNFEVQIGAGVNPVPTNFFDIGYIAKSRTDVVELSCPVVVKFKQPLRVSTRFFAPDGASTITTVDSNGVNVKVMLIGELGIQKVVN